MRYSYAYKTSDGVRHVAEITAKSREEVFSTLRQKGIKPIKVVAADGSKANGAVHGIGKGVFFVSILVVAILTGALASLIGRRQDDGAAAQEAVRIQAKPLPRQTIPGDRRRIADAKRDAFSNRVESYLAQFVEPGRTVADPDGGRPSEKDFSDSLAVPIFYSEDEFSEQIMLKRMVAWIKREMSVYVRGGGKIGDYLALLVQRQETEADHRAKAERHLNQLLGDKRQVRAAYDFLLKANAQLQGMGIYPLAMPDSLRKCQQSEEFD